MANAYEELRESLAGFEQASKLYDKVSHYGAARQEAVKFAVDEGDQTAAQILSDPNTSIEKVASGVGISLNRKQKKLEDSVENSFDEILNNYPDGILESLLMQLEPKKDNGYDEFAKAHQIYRTALLKDKGEERKKSVHDHYNKQYEIKPDDSDEDKEEKEIIKSFFLGLYDSEKNIQSKYVEIHKDEIEKFEKVLKDKTQLLNHIKEMIPDDKKEKIKFFRQMVALHKEAEKAEQASGPN